LGLSTFNAEVRDVFGVTLDNITLSAPSSTPVMLNGPGIRSLTVSDGGFDTALDNLFVDFRQTKPTADVGLAWGVMLTQDGTIATGYRLELQPDEDQLQLVKHSGGAEVILATAPVDIEPAVWYDVAAVSHNGVIQGWLDGVVKIEYDDSATPLPVGSAGVFVEGEGMFDNLSVLADPVPNMGLVDLNPDVLNLKSHGNYITAHIELPLGFDPADTDVATVTLAGVLATEASPAEIGDADHDGIPDLMVKFNRQEAIALVPLTPGEQALEVSWEMTTGAFFAVEDTIRVICPGKK
jgi:hypothetical protein